MAELKRLGKMPPAPHTTKFLEAKTSALEILSRLTTGDIGVLAAAHKLSSLRHTLLGDARDDDWDVLVGINSETDHLPLEEHRKNWAPEALARKDVETKKAEDFFRARAVHAAQNLFRRYEERRRSAGTDNSGELRSLPCLTPIVGKRKHL